MTSRLYSNENEGLFRFRQRLARDSAVVERPASQLAGCGLEPCQNRVAIKLQVQVYIHFCALRWEDCGAESITLRLRRISIFKAPWRCRRKYILFLLACLRNSQRLKPCLLQSAVSYCNHTFIGCEIRLFINIAQT